MWNMGKVCYLDWDRNDIVWGYIVSLDIRIMLLCFNTYLNSEFIYWYFLCVMNETYCAHGMKGGVALLKKKSFCLKER